MEHKMMTAMAQEKAYRGPKFFGWRILNMYSICMRNMVQRILQCADAQGTHQNGMRGGAKSYSIQTKNRKNIKHVGNVLFRPIK